MGTLPGRYWHHWFGSDDDLRAFAQLLVDPAVSAPVVVRALAFIDDHCHGLRGLLSVGLRVKVHLRRIPVSNRFFFCFLGFAGDCFNFSAIIAETFLAASVFKASEMQMGLLGAMFGGYALACVFTGMLSDRVGRRPLCLLACLGMIAAYVVAAHAPSMQVLYLASFFRSVSTSLLWPPLMAWMTETSGRKGFSGLLGAYNIAWACGILAGYFIGGWAFEHISPSAPFYFAITLGLLTFGVLLVCVPLQAELAMESHELESGDVVFFVREGLVLMTSLHFAVALVLYMFPKVVGNAMGETAQSVLHVIRMVGQVLAFVAMTWFGGWHFRRWPIWLCLVLSVGGMLLVGTCARPGLYAVGSAALGVGMGISFMLSAYYTLALMESKGLGSGMQESLVGGGSVLGPLLGGVVAAGTSPRTSIVLGCVPLVAVGLWSAAAMRRRIVSGKNGNAPAQTSAATKGCRANGE